MGSDRTNTNNDTWGKNGEGWVWILWGFGIGLLLLAKFLDPSGPSAAVAVPCAASTGIALRIIRSLKKEIAELKSGDADESTAAQDSE